MDRRHFLKGVTVGAALAVGGLATREAQGAEPSASDSSFCFCVAADPHCSEGVTKGLEQYGSGVDRFMKSIRAIEQLDAAEKPDFLLVLGDIHPAALKDRLPEIAIPLHVTPGNHEADKDTRKLLRSLFPGDFSVAGHESDYYSFIHKGARFISVCDAGAGGDHVGHLCSEITQPSGQCEWLEQELAGPETRKIGFAHIPPERDGRDVTMFMSRNDSRWFNECVARTRPTALFFGHLHRATEEYAIGPTRVFLVRSCTWNAGKAPIGFLHVRVTPDALVVREIQTGEYA